MESEEEIALCPHCGGELVYHCRAIRPATDITGTQSKYSIRILRCDNKACPTKYHRELPDIMIPYRRYDADTIEEAIDQDKTMIAVAAEEGTIRRWRKWFAGNATAILMALLSVKATMDHPGETSSLSAEKTQASKPIEIIKRIVGRRIQWLRESVRILVNSAKWSFNRSAFLTG